MEDSGKDDHVLKSFYTRVYLVVYSGKPSGVPRL